MVFICIWNLPRAIRWGQREETCTQKKKLNGDREFPYLQCPVWPAVGRIKAEMIMKMMTSIQSRWAKKRCQNICAKKTYGFSTHFAWDEFEISDLLPTLPICFDNFEYPLGTTKYKTYLNWLKRIWNCKIIRKYWLLGRLKQYILKVTGIHCYKCSWYD